VIDELKIEPEDVMGIFVAEEGQVQTRWKVSLVRSENLPANRLYQYSVEHLDSSCSKDTLKSMLS
jgi:hypothetical protein